MTSQLTDQRPAPASPKVEETNERIYLQAWFWMAVLCSIAMVVLIING